MREMTFLFKVRFTRYIKTLEITSVLPIKLYYSPEKYETSNNITAVKVKM